MATTRALDHRTPTVLCPPYPSLSLPLALSSNPPTPSLIALEKRLYELNSMKRENASLSTSTKEEVGIENTNSSSSGEGNDALAPELEKRNNLGRDEGVQTTDGEDASLSATMKEQVETNRCLEERIAALTTELERRNTERDEEHRRQLHNRLDAIDQLEQENGQLQAKIRRHDEILSRLREASGLFRSICLFSFSSHLL